MKKTLTIMLLMIASVIGAQARERSTTNVNELPAPARTFIANTFKSKVNHIKIDGNMFGRSEYDVILCNGTEIEFDANGNWKEVDCGISAVPASVVPATIAKYVKDNYGKAKIVKIERDKNKYEVDLSTGQELKFDMQGRRL